MFLVRVLLDLDDFIRRFSWTKTIIYTYEII